MDEPINGGLKLTDEARGYLANDGWGEGHGPRIVRRLLDWVTLLKERLEVAKQCAEEFEGRNAQLVDVMKKVHDLITSLDGMSDDDIRQARALLLDAVCPIVPVTLDDMKWATGVLNAETLRKRAATVRQQAIDRLK